MGFNEQNILNFYKPLASCYFCHNVHVRLKAWLHFSKYWAKLEGFKVQKKTLRISKTGQLRVIFA
jgi:hypothetical protein